LGLKLISAHFIFAILDRPFNEVTTTQQFSQQLPKATNTWRMSTFPMRLLYCCIAPSLVLAISAQAA